MRDLEVEPVMRPFIARHPYEVWAGAEYHSRFASLQCAARTAAGIKDAVVVATFPQGGEAVSHQECVQIAAELRSRVTYRGGD